MAVLTKQCECSDPGCPMHTGKSECDQRIMPDEVVTVFRIDMEDATGTDMCERCADDALESGVFTTEG